MTELGCTRGWWFIAVLDAAAARSWQWRPSLVLCDFLHCSCPGMAVAVACASVLCSGTLVGAPPSAVDQDGVLLQSTVRIREDAIRHGAAVQLDDQGDIATISFAVVVAITVCLARCFIDGCPMLRFQRPASMDVFLQILFAQLGVVLIVKRHHATAMHIDQRRLCGFVVVKQHHVCMALRRVLEVDHVAAVRIEVFVAVLKYVTAAVRGVLRCCVSRP